MLTVTLEFGIVRQHCSGKNDDIVTKFGWYNTSVIVLQSKWTVNVNKSSCM